MAEVTAIILAAGFSRRMGERNKLLLPVSGVPMIRHMVDTYSAATDGRVLVITGHAAHAVETVLEGSAAVTVFNPDYARGQPSSVACGLRAAGESNMILMGLGDQPLLTARDIGSLLAAHAAADTTRISIPILGETRGNPIVIPGTFRTRLLADQRSPGCKRFTREHPEHVQFHNMPTRGFYLDVDTPEAYAALQTGQLEAIS